MSRKDKILLLMKKFTGLFFWLILVGTGCNQTITNEENTSDLTEPSADFSLEKISFGEVPIGSVSNEQALKIKNAGGGELIIKSLQTSGDFEAKLNFDRALGAGDFDYLLVNFSPTQSGDLTGELTILTNASDEPTILPLSGRGLSSALFISPKAINFGEVKFGESSDSESEAAPTETKPARAVITVKNIGSQSMTGVSVSNPAEPDSTFTQTNTCPELLEAGETCFVTVTFTPSAVGEFTGQFYIDSSATASTTISLSGKAIEEVESKTEITE